MINKILNKRLHDMKNSLLHRKLWPIDDLIGIDPFDADVWRNFLDSSLSCVPVRTGALPKFSRTSDEELHELIGAPTEVVLRRGCARPYLLWAHKADEKEAQMSMPSPIDCKPIDYLKLEDVIHGFSALEAMLLEHN